MVLGVKAPKHQATSHGASKDVCQLISVQQLFTVAREQEELLKCCELALAHLQDRRKQSHTGKSTNFKSICTAGSVHALVIKATFRRKTFSVPRTTKNDKIGEGQARSDTSDNPATLTPRAINQSGKV